jgi:hypothetical protein
LTGQSALERQFDGGGPLKMKFRAATNRIQATDENGLRHVFWTQTVAICGRYCERTEVKFGN